jgi:hypothetical protein
MKILRTTEEVVKAIEDYMVEFGRVMEQGADSIGKADSSGSIDTDLRHRDEWLLLSDGEKRAAVLSLTFTVSAKEVEYEDCTERKEGQW